MGLLEEIKSKTSINIERFLERLKEDLKEENEEKILDSIYEVFIMILDIIKQAKIPEKLYTTSLNMTKDYWCLNKYGKLYKDTFDESGNIKSISIGDTKTEFVTKTQIEGSSEDILLNIYKTSLYRHRKMRW